VTNSSSSSTSSSGSSSGAAFAEPTWGEVDPAVFERIVVLSPHFDDAAMGAGHLLGSYDDTTVVTVLGGRPPAYPDPPSDWDALGGFKAGDDVVALRREEDAAAMEVLESSYRWLEFADHQYLAPPDRPTPEEVAPVLASTIADLNPTSVFVPMGLGNPDHVMVHDASLLVRAGEDAAGATAGTGGSGQARREWFCYEDHGYKHIPGLLAWRVAKLLRSKPWPTPAIVPHVPDEERKRRAIWCYTSQIPPLEQDHALTARMEGRVPEQFWRLAPPPKGWEGMADFI
jgi:LmbE family N-acetylglucosaminyl deacetylase